MRTRTWSNNEQKVHCFCAPLRHAHVLFRLVTHGFNVVSVRVEDVRSEIVGMMFRAKLRRAVVATTGSKGLSVERLHLCPRRRTESDMDRRLDRRTLDDKELLSLPSETHAARLCRPHGNSAVAVIRSGASARS